jgi:L-ascorbate 6-phosphate lactonase
MSDVTSTWGDWFVAEEIEAAEPSGLSIWYLGCNGFVVRSPEATVYVDPYFGNGDPPRLVRMIPVPMDPADATLCDAVFVTHEHVDHMHEPSYRPLAEDLGADVYAPEAAYTDPDYEPEAPIPDGQAHVVDEGETIEVGDLTVHVRGGNDPDAIEEVSYVFEHEAGTYFNGGDSRPAPLWEDVGAEFDVDLGSLTFGTRGRIHDPETGETSVTQWYNTENDVVEIANALELDRLVPCHWDMWKGVGADPKALHEHASSFEYPESVEPVRIGDRVDVGRPGIRPLRAL